MGRRQHVRPKTCWVHLALAPQGSPGVSNMQIDPSQAHKASSQPPKQAQTDWVSWSVTTSSPAHLGAPSFAPSITRGLTAG